ncbi:MAG: hypothetical protein M5R36_14540 [Deltaproteobacteria bacterium]|nr:hypothetical protein [Deltaproteobacteria bacterium]
MTDRLILILLAMALLCSFAACGCGDDDDDDDAGGDGGEQFATTSISAGWSARSGFDSLDACLDYFAGLGDDAQACVAAAGNCDELENCFDLGDDDDDDDDSVGPECVDEPTIVDDDWPDPPADGQRALRANLPRRGRPHGRGGSHAAMEFR